MNWIDSAGGPLIVLPLSHLLLWEGSLPPSAGRIVEATFRWNPESGTATDYDSACDVDDLIGLINLGDLEVLVLGDQPLSTAWLPFADRPGGVFVRWYYGENEESVSSRQTEMLECETGEPEVTLHVRSSPLLVFDSAIAGFELDKSERLLLELTPGTYHIGSAEFNPDSMTSMLLHRIELISHETARKDGRKAKIVLGNANHPGASGRQE